MTDATFVRDRDDNRVTAAAAVAAGEVWQLKDGRAGVKTGQDGGAVGDRVKFTTTGQFTFPKTDAVNFLDGGRAFWDASASAVNFKKVGDRDFYLGRFVGDAAAADTACVVNINVDPPYDVDLARDPFVTAIVGTQALGGLALLRRGGAHDAVISSVNEAQKVDALSVDGFAPLTANAIVEFAFTVPNDGAGTVVDVSVGVASGTHATDADAIASHLLMHLDANNTNINFQSKDGTTTVAATDSTKDYAEGQALANRVEVWFDMRDPADVQVYVDGVNVLPATVFNVSAAAAASWFLLLHVEKSAAADAYEFQLDWLRARLSEQNGT